MRMNLCGIEKKFHFGGLASKFDPPTFVCHGMEVGPSGAPDGEKITGPACGFPRKSVFKNPLAAHIFKTGSERGHMTSSSGRVIEGYNMRKLSQSVI